MSQSKSMLRWGIALVVLVGAAAAGWYMLQPKQAESAPRTVTVSVGDIEETVLASGVIEASTLVSVGAEVSGSIETLNVALGDTVKAGDVVAKVASRDQEVAVKSPRPRWPTSPHSASNRRPASGRPGWRSSGPKSCDRSN